MAKNNKVRDFVNVMESVKRAAPAELKEYLENNSSFWAPELCWERLSESVQKFIRPCSTDRRSVKVYARLCGVSKREMRKRFLIEGC